MSLSTGTFIASVTILWPYTFLYTLKLIYNYGKFSRDLQTQYKIEIGKKSEKKIVSRFVYFVKNCKKPTDIFCKSKFYTSFAADHVKTLLNFCPRKSL